MHYVALAYNNGNGTFEKPHKVHCTIIQQTIRVNFLKLSNYT